MDILLQMTGRLINIARDLIFVILYVRTIDSNRQKAAKRQLIGTCCLIFSCLIITTIDYYYYETLFYALKAAYGHALIAVLRDLLYLVTYFTYIWILKELPLRVVIYDALLICSIWLACHNIALTPITKPIVDYAFLWVSSPYMNWFLSIVILNLVCIVLYFIISKCIPLKLIKQVDGLRLLLVLSLFLLGVYLNSTLKRFEFIDEEYRFLLSSYMILFQLFFLLFIGYFEHYQYSTQVQNHMELENQAVYSLLRSIEGQQKNDTLLRHMRHDFHNLLISLRYLIANKENEKAIEYIDNLSKERLSSRDRIKTGNLILDGLLAHKIEIADANDIRISASVDFSSLNSIENTDLCIIFGNLLDNALEACKQVHDGTRFINLRGRQVGETMIYVIENSFSGKISFAGDIPVTTKTDKRLHGLGLNSVKLTMDKYAGTVAFSSKGQVFSAVCAFPLPIGTKLM